MDLYEKNIKKIKITEAYKICTHGVDIHDIGDEVSPLWGKDSISLSEEDIQALKDGKILTTSVCGEYRLFIVFKNE